MAPPAPRSASTSRATGGGRAALTPPDGTDPSCAPPATCWTWGPRTCRRAPGPSTRCRRAAPRSAWSSAAGTSGPLRRHRRDAARRREAWPRGRRVILRRQPPRTRAPGRRPDAAGAGAPPPRRRRVARVLAAHGGRAGVRRGRPRGWAGDGARGARVARARAHRPRTGRCSRSPRARCSSAWAGVDEAAERLREAMAWSRARGLHLLPGGGGHLATPRAPRAGGAPGRGRRAAARGDDGMERADRRLEQPAAQVFLAEARWRAGDEDGHDDAARRGPRGRGAHGLVRPARRGAGRRAGRAGAVHRRRRRAGGRLAAPGPRGRGVARVEHHGRGPDRDRHARPRCASRCEGRSAT